jgi:hypothetical protein
VVHDIIEKVDVLRELPKLVRKAPEIGEEKVRELGMYSYRIMYEQIGETIYIRGVSHRRRHVQAIGP